MLRYLNRLLLAATLLFAVPALVLAQRADYVLNVTWPSLSNVNGQKTLQQYWVTEQGQTQAYVESTVVPQLFLRFNGLGWTDAEIMQFNLFPAYWNEAVLKGNGGGQPITGRITSNNGIVAPPGDYLVNFPCIIDGGEYYGQGVAYSGVPGSATHSMGTTLRYNAAGWLAGVRTDAQYTAGGTTYNISFDVRNLIQSTSWQVASGATSYMPYGKLEGFQLIGDNGGWWTGTQTSNGVGLWDVGECFEVNRILAHFFNGYGIACVRGTPASISNPSTSVNALGGIGLIGTSLATIWIWGPSGDDNPALIVQIDGYGRTAGGNLSIVGYKSESGKHTPYKGQCLLWQRNDCNGVTSVLGAQMANDYTDIDALFCMQSGGWGQILNVSACYGYNFRTVVHDVTNRKRWPGGAPWSPVGNLYSFVWSSRNGGTYHDLVNSVMVPGLVNNATGRLGVVGLGAPYDYNAGTPLYNILGGAPPPAPTCDWVIGPWGAWGSCISNIETRTRSVTTTIPACTPVSSMPPTSESQACGTPPVSCTWVTGAWSAWSACVNSLQTQTRTVSSSVPGCIPTGTQPATVQTQACVSPPPSGAVVFSRCPWSNANASATEDITNITVKRIVFTGFTLTTAPNYQRLFVEPTTPPVVPTGLRIYPDGRFRAPNGQYATQSVANIQRNVLYPNLEINLQTATTVDKLLAIPGTGSALQFTCTCATFYAP